MEVFNQFSELCNGGGGEASIACTLRQVAVTGLSILPGAVVGLLIAYMLDRRRAAKRG